MSSIGSALRDATLALAAKRVDNPRLDARLLLAAALRVEMTYLFNHPDEKLDDESERRLAALLARRCDREPISQILGCREFWSLNFRVSRDVLTPRPDSETLIEAVLAEFPDRQRPYRLLDLGTGSGCLLLALLSELPQAFGIGVDRSRAALALAGENAIALGFAARCQWLEGDWCAGLSGPFDIIISNPPYIPTGEIDHLDPEVAFFDPRGALDGGADGLDCYRLLAPQIAARLAPGGIAALELGAGQVRAVEKIMLAAGLAIGAIRRDLGGIERCLLARC